MNQKRRDELMTQLGNIIVELGWEIIVPLSPQDQEVKGLVIGTDEFLNQILYRFALSGDEVIIHKEEATAKVSEKKEDSDDSGNNGEPTFH